jgi:hypothetical protein
MKARKKPTKNLALKIAIIETGKTARRIARLSGIGEVRLSAFVRGVLVPNDREKVKLSKVLQRDPATLWPSQTADEAIAS